MANIIIKKPDSYGKTRSEQEENMRKDWGATMTDEELDRCKYMEHKIKEATGSTKNKLNPVNIKDFWDKETLERGIRKK